MSYLLSIDQGTTSSRAILFNATGGIEYIAQKELQLYYPQDGWVEQDAREIWADTCAVIQEVLEFAKAQGFTVARAGITNQRETTVVWDRHTGEPIYNAIVWQDRRTAQYCATLRGDGLEAQVQEKTGLLLDPYFSATKIKWILDHVDGARVRVEKDDLLCGTVDSFLLWKLTGGGVHATDITNASRTMLFNIHDLKWDADLLKVFDIPEKILPEVTENITEFGRIDSGLFGFDLVIGGMAGDQHAAMIGQGCLTRGSVKSTYGTGCFMLVNTGEKAVKSDNRLLTTIAFSLGGEVRYALEGSIFNAGTAVQFLRDNLKLIENAKETEAIALGLDDNGGVYFVPAFTGLGAPYWDPDAKGVIYGLRRDSSSAHIVRAALEAQAYQTQDLMAAMVSDSGAEIKVLRVDGGLVANKFMCQFLSDITRATVDVPIMHEATAWGAAMLAGVQCGVYASIEEAAALWSAEAQYKPSLDETSAQACYDGWKKAVSKA